VPNIAESPQTWLDRRERIKAKGINGNGMGMPLGIAVQLFPTPRAREAGNWQQDNKGRRLKRITLTGAAKLWPTATARDWRSGKASSETHARNSRPLNEVAAQGQASGALNPTWVEWLMGFPLAWTDLED
jgi:DNA (cytosine-5)-methyltransferase 1